MKAAFPVLFFVHIAIANQVKLSSVLTYLSRTNGLKNEFILLTSLNSSSQHFTDFHEAFDVNNWYKANLISGQKVWNKFEEFQTFVLFSSIG